MSASDYIPHALVTALATVVSFVYRDHVKQDDRRFDKVSTELTNISSRQVEISDKIAENHAEILRVLLENARKES
jgi:hypothetical protein